MIKFEKQAYDGHFPEIWRGECKILPGGFKPLQTFAVGTVLHRGLAVYVDFANHSAAIVKVAKVLSGGTTTKIRIAKGNCFQVGDCIMKIGTADKSPLITAIDYTNAGYDVLTVASAITGIAADDVITEATPYEAAVTSGENQKAAVDAAPKYTPNAVLGAVKEFDGKGIDALDVAYEAVVLYPSLTYPVLDSWLAATGSPCLKSNPNILFITQ